MVSFQANGRQSIPELDHDSSKKRKWDEPQTQGILDKRSKPESTRSIYEIELHLETPLPLEWQRCLDIQSGQIHFYNTRTHKRTSRDPRRSPEPTSPDHMSLDLELNLPCDPSQRKNYANDPIKQQNSGGSIRSLDDFFNDSRRDNNKSSGGGTPHPSWLAFENDPQEMVATVCTRCHMLVMLCKSSPACPNCKFLHPPDQSPPKLFKPRLSLLC